MPLHRIMQRKSIQIGDESPFTMINVVWFTEMQDQPFYTIIAIGYVITWNPRDWIENLQGLRLKPTEKNLTNKPYFTVNDMMYEDVYLSEMLQRVNISHRLSADNKEITLDTTCLDSALWKIEGVRTKSTYKIHRDNIIFEYNVKDSPNSKLLEWIQDQIRVVQYLPLTAAEDTASEYSENDSSGHDMPLSGNDV